MKSNPKVNKYPYIFLGMIHLIMVIFTLYKSKERKKHVVLLLSYTGFAYIFEYIVVVVLNGYVYRPKFLKQKNLDNISGAVWSQFFYVPTMALFITVFKMGWKIKLLFCCYFSMIERIFIYLGAFKNQWWRTKYTFILLFLSFLLNDKWNEELTKRKPYVLFTSFFHLIQVTWMNLIYFFAVLRKVRYGRGYFLSWKDHFEIAPFFGYIISFLSALWLYKGGLHAKIKTITMMIIFDFILIKKHLLKVKSCFLLPIIYFFMLFASSKYQKLIKSIS